MAKKKSLEDIKHSDKVINALQEGAYFFMDIQKMTSLDSKTLQLVLSRMNKHGYIAKDNSGWFFEGELW